MTDVTKVTLSANELDQISGGAWSIKEKIAAGATAAAAVATAILCGWTCGWAIGKKKKKKETIEEDEFFSCKENDLSSLSSADEYILMEAREGHRPCPDRLKKYL